MIVVSCVRICLFSKRAAAHWPHQGFALEDDDPASDFALAFMGWQALHRGQCVCFTAPGHCGGFGLLLLGCRLYYRCALILYANAAKGLAAVH